jgi:hypothetical protein
MAVGVYGRVYGPTYGASAQGTAVGAFRWAGFAAGVNSTRANSAAGNFSWSGRAVGSVVKYPAADFIQAQSRSITYACTIGGVPYPVKSFDTDAQLKDIPAAVAQLAGVAASQVQFTLAHATARALSPFQGVAPTPAVLATGAPVTLSVSFWPGQPGVGTVVFTGVIFTGYLLNYRFDAVADMSITAQDPSYKCSGTFSLPMAAVDPTTRPASPDPGYSSLAPTEAALRASGIYLTAPPSSTDPKVRGKYLMMAVSGYGGNMPEVGELISSGVVASRGQGKFCPDVWRSSFAVFRAAHVTRRPLGAMWLDGWVSILPGSDSVIPVDAFNRDGVSYPGVSLGYYGGVAQFVLSGWGGVHIAQVPVTAADGLPHYWRGSYRYTPTAGGGKGTIAITIQVDSTSTTVTEAADLDDLRLWDETGIGDDSVVYRSVGKAAVEAFEMWGVPVGDPATVGQDRSQWSAGTPSVVAPSPVRLDVIVGQEGLNCWATIQEIAQAEGALAWFAPDGSFHRDTLAVFNRRKTALPTFDYGKDRVDNLPVAVSTDGARRQVSAQVQKWTVDQSTPARPVWLSDSILTAGARRTSTVAVATDNLRGLNLYPLVNTVGPTSGAGDLQSHFQVVDAAQVGDPAAILVKNVTVKVAPTNTGFTFTVNNPNPFDVAFWSPTLQGPYLELQGSRVTLGASQTVTADGNPTAQDDLQLDDNQWRTDLPASRRLVRSIAAGTYNAIPELANITVPGDPRRFLGELVSVFVPSMMANPERCIVVSIGMSGDTGSNYRMTLGLRPIGPPAGWLAGVPGRSEAGVTTYAPLR